MKAGINTTVLKKPIPLPPVLSLIDDLCFDQIPYFIAPDPRSLPSIPENVSMGQVQSR